MSAARTPQAARRAEDVFAVSGRLEVRGAALGASVGVPGLTVACLCDEICHSGEVYSDEHEVCVDSEITGEAQTENLRRDR